MKILPYTESNVELIQQFIDETKRRILNGVELTFSKKAFDELSVLNLENEISENDIENAIMNLKTQDYYRGIDPSKKADFNVCAFYKNVGAAAVGIYLKYGIENEGLQILIFSNHPPMFPVHQPFKV